MPGRDGTGPYGAWKNCEGRPEVGRGAGFGRGSYRGMYANEPRGGYARRSSQPISENTMQTTDVSSLKRRAAQLESELAVIKRQLDSTTDDADGRSDT